MQQLVDEPRFKKTVPTNTGSCVSEDSESEKVSAIVFDDFCVEIGARRSGKSNTRIQEIRYI